MFTVAQIENKRNDYTFKIVEEAETINPVFAVFQDGKPIRSYTLNEIKEILIEDCLQP